MVREMKDSGIEWEKSVPLTWNKCRLKDYYTFEKGKNASVYTKNYNGLHKGIYPVYSGQTENNGIMGQIDTYDYDIQECLFTTTVGAKVMAPKILKGKFSLSQNCLIMRNYTHYKCFNQFIYYLLFPLFDYEKSKIPSYMQPSLRIEDLKTYTFYIPTFTEQQKIASFLDEKTKKIDQEMKRAKSTIKMLDNYKQSVIVKAVTKGLDSNVEMKDSNIEWIEKIPKNWNIIPFKFVITESNSGEVIDKTWWNEGEDLLYTCQKTPMYSNFPNFPKNKRTQKGDLLLTRNATPYVFLPQENTMYSNVVQRIKIQTDYFDVKYVSYAIKKAADACGTANGIGIPSYNMNIWDNLFIPMPSKKEQQEIASFLDKKIKAIDNSIDALKRNLHALEKYKKSLIYEYVTGKKEVS